MDSAATKKQLSFPTKPDFSRTPKLAAMRDKYIRHLKGENQTKLTGEQYRVLAALLASRDVPLIADFLVKVPSLRCAIVHCLMKYLRDIMNQMGNRKHGYISCLMKKDAQEMNTFDWATVVEEGCEKVPELIQVNI